MLAIGVRAAIGGGAAVFWCFQRCQGGGEVKVAALVERGRVWEREGVGVGLSEM